MQPNILLTIADDQRGSAMGCVGLERVATPYLDTLADRGVRCIHTYHFGSNHGAVCSPSRAMLHSGAPYMELDEALLGPTYPPPGYTTTVPLMLGQKLHQAGYHCFATGKWHNGIDSFRAAFDSGDKIFFNGMADHWFTPVHDFDLSGRYSKEAAYIADGFSTEVFGQAAVDFIRSRRDQDQPFFCYCAFTAPHDPRTPPDDYRRRYDPKTIPLPPNYLPEHPFDNGEMSVRDERLLSCPREPAEIRHSLAEYYGMISHMDHWIGRIHAALDEIGQRENTIVIHTADHGLAIGQHGLLGKQNMYEHSTQVPLIAAGPGLPVHAVREGLCYQHDLHPTILDLANVSKRGVWFQTLLPLLRGENTGRPFITSHYRNLQRMIRDARYKLIEYTVGGQRRVQLFDLAEDTWECHDLSTDPTHQHRVEALSRQLNACMTENTALRRKSNIDQKLPETCIGRPRERFVLS